MATKKLLFLLSFLSINLVSAAGLICNDTKVVTINQMINKIKCTGQSVWPSSPEGGVLIILFILFIIVLLVIKYLMSKNKQ